VVLIKTPKKSGGATPRFAPQGETPPAALLHQHTIPPVRGMHAFNRMFRVGLRVVIVLPGITPRTTRPRSGTR
jgi:hypothetical protein